MNEYGVSSRTFAARLRSLQGATPSHRARPATKLQDARTDCTAPTRNRSPNQGLAACWVVQLSCKSYPPITFYFSGVVVMLTQHTNLLKPGQERVDDSLEHLLSLAPRFVRATECEVPQLVLVHRQRLQLTTASALEFKVL